MHHHCFSMHLPAHAGHLHLLLACSKHARLVCFPAETSSGALQLVCGAVSDTHSPLCIHYY